MLVFMLAASLAFAIATGPVCDEGRFGASCSGECHCELGPHVCNQTSGACEQGGCTAGFQNLPFCQTGTSLSIPSIRRIAATSAEVHWQNWIPHVNVSFYSLEVEEDNSSWYEVAAVQRSREMLSAQGLRPYTKYRFRVVLWWRDHVSTHSDNGLPSEPVTTLCAAPGDIPAIDFDSVEISDGRIMFSWKVPIMVNCDSIVEHSVLITFLPSCGRDVLPVSNASASLPLPVDSELCLSVTSINNAGYSSLPSKIIKVTSKGNISQCNMTCRGETSVDFLIVSSEKNIEVVLLDRNESTIVLKLDRELDLPVKIEGLETKGKISMLPRTDPIISQENGSYILLISGLHPSTSYSVSFDKKSAFEESIFWTAPESLHSPNPPQTLNISNTAILLQLPSVKVGDFIQITHVLVIVADVSAGDGVQNDLLNKLQMFRRDSRLPASFDEDSTFPTLSSPGFWIAAKFPLSQSGMFLEREFLLGDDQIYEDMVNWKLTPGHRYEICLGLVRQYDGASVYSVSSRLSVVIPVLLSPLGVTSGNVGLAVGLSLFSILAIGFVAILVCMFWHRKLHKLNNPVFFSPNIEYQGVRVSDCNIDSPHAFEPPNPPGPSESYLHNPVVTKRTNPLQVDKIIHHINLRENSEYKLSHEFQSLPQGLISPANVAQLPSNLCLNRSKVIVPFDKNKVRLLPISADDNAYINASYVKSIVSEFYIVTQCPLEETSGEFWRMVFEQDVSCIVMLMSLKEPDFPDYHSYWPLKRSKSHLYHHIQVQNIDLQQTAHYLIRKFRICSLLRGQESDVRIVTHWQFTSWTPGGIPSQIRPYLDFVLRIQKEREAGRCPVVHCHKGGGRSGMYIALDSLLLKGRESGKVDVLQCVTKLRIERLCLVKTLKQYRFIHQCLGEYFHHRDTQISCEDFESVFTRVIPIEDGKGFSLLAQEFHAAQFALDYENQESSRIKASYDSQIESIDLLRFDSFLKKDMFLMTPSGIQPEVFWMAVHGSLSHGVVLLHGASDCPQSLWPQCSSFLSCGQYGVLFESSHGHGQHVMHKLFVSPNRDSSGKPLSLILHEFPAWSSSTLLPQVSKMVSLVTKVQQWWESNGHGRPLVLHSSSGTSMSRAVLFILVWNLLERLQHEGIVDIFSSTRSIRTVVPNAVSDLSQYRFLYKCVKEFIDHHQPFSHQETLLKQLV
ncbi:hypothetical protein CAPTEDRAFT_229320 [Capitella teleta]|uniref:Uncharacterized protein n=1 Tax=Capitella teleta TaxID=283909 RepID=R7VJD1_CAPTE|nr:hypothetical protein CAPTEDRAFT_229320 [Capitella teleta]|eukprot:ELU18759.1 hypothetical protein CAPTEDRAFT_229320 [Capitella teleta]